MVSIDDIKTFFRGRIALSEPLAKYTSLRIGGPADYFLEPADRDDTIRIVTYFQQQHVPFTIVGKGSNLLVSDDGIRGAVIHLETGLTSMHAEGNRVFVDAGVSIVRFVDFCVQRGLQGVEMLAGIPGTVGGGIIMNAGAFGSEISKHLVDVEVIKNGSIVILKKDEIAFAYRRSNLNGNVVLSASFLMPPGDRMEIAKIRQELLLTRNRTQPTNYPNSGSMFKNPPGTFAAKLIDQAGLKGMQIGNARISDRHANFIVNLDGATAKDVLELIMLERKTVFEKFGVALELEVKLLGFPESVLNEIRS